ncbi:MAG: carboxypeptidase regulatory-like domain-containing protein, partial [Bacteroidota bacterium]|nr:carboxypeptidase regulatory-like domain-containing protein [Bacteroidota bacterium]
MKKIYNISFILAFFIFTLSGVTFCQSITTGGIIGSIVDETGAFLPGATIKAVHIPSNTTYGNTSRSDGKYNIPNMRVGGPYTISVSFVGYKDIKKENVYIELGTNLLLNFTLRVQAMELGEVSIIADKNTIINPNRTGASTNVGEQVITEFPTISRSFQDFYKFNAQFSGSPITSSGTSANGKNNRYNNIQIDGAVYNDLFGLASSGTPGGQTGTNPISLDAIQEFQVVIAPYDVRMGGFTGGGINAITRSGTNTFSGSVFGYGRNQDLVGKSPDAARTKYSNFNEYQTGFRLGGPIIKDQLFFFVNAEFTKKTTPIDNIAITQATNKTPDSISQRFQSILMNKYGYNPGGYNTFDASRPSTKLFAKLDFNLNEANKLSFRYNYVDASDDNMPRTIQNILFNDRNYKLKSTTGSAVLQLNTTFGNIANNELIVGYTTVRDKRSIIDNPFPSIKVYEAKTLIAGSEEFSIANKLDQDIFELTDNFSYYLGDHVFTVGTHNEYFNFKNLYIQNKYGYYEFNSLSDFEKGKFSRYQYSYSLTGNPDQDARFNVVQLGFYAQDEWTAIQNLKLTGGLRIDIPIFPDKPAFNPLISTLFGYNTSTLPTGKVLFSPRIGFNWDIKSDQSLQVRGGVGMFTGKVPYVWISNQYGNTGIEFARIDYRYNAADSLKFIQDVNNQMKTGVKGIKAGSSEVDITDPNFKMPQVLRLNAALDQQLPYNYVATVEFVYSKTLNDILYQDINLGAANTTLTGPGGRPVYGDTSKGTFSMRKISQS